MIELSTHIEYLLLSQAQVSVPQLGTFIVKDMSSRRVDEEGIFLPPYRTVSFQWDEEEPGDDFVSSLSKLHNLSRHDARIMCVEYVDELQQTLADEGSVSVGSMGYLLRDEDTQEISFMPMQSGIASPAYYGLDAIPFAKLSNDIRQQRDKKQKGRKTKITSIVTDRDTITIRINRRVFNYVTAVAASIVLFFTFTSPYGTINTGSQKAESVLTAPILIPRAEEPTAKEVKAQVAVATAKENVEVVPAKAASHQGTSEVATSPYVIVLASAVSKKNAISFADKLKGLGYNAQACEAGGMVRVIIPGYASQEDAYTAIRQMKTECSDFANAWPYQLKGEVKPIE